MSSDEINSISDTTESLQLRDSKDNFLQYHSSKLIFLNKNSIQLDPSLDELKPNLMFYSGRGEED